MRLEFLDAFIDDELRTFSSCFQKQRTAVGLGFNFRSEFEKVTAQIAETRNWVMHPVRPLIFDTADVATLRRTVASVLRLHKIVDQIRNTKAD
jgi:hypothetical protein